MYHADSDILTLVLTLLTFAAGIYSSVKKKKKGESRGATEDSGMGVAQEEMDEESPFFSIQSVFDEIEDELEEAASSDTENGDVAGRSYAAVPEFKEHVAEAAEVESIEYSDDIQDSAAVQNTIGNTLLDAGTDSGKVEQNEEKESSGKSLKQKVKMSPKDMVLFAEIMNPKHKEF